MRTHWMSVYQHKSPNPGHTLEIEDAADAIWKACEEHPTGESFKKASALVEEHIEALPAVKTCPKPVFGAS